MAKLRSTSWTVCPHYITFLQQIWKGCFKSHIRMVALELGTETSTARVVYIRKQPEIPSDTTLSERIPSSLEKFWWGRKEIWDFMEYLDIWDKLGFWEKR